MNGKINFDEREIKNAEAVEQNFVRPSMGRALDPAICFLVYKILVTASTFFILRSSKWFFNVSPRKIFCSSRWCKLFFAICHSFREKSKSSSILLFSTSYKWTLLDRIKLFLFKSQIVKTFQIFRCIFEEAAPQCTFVKSKSVVVKLASVLFNSS